VVNFVIRIAMAILDHPSVALRLLRLLYLIYLLRLLRFLPPFAFITLELHFHLLNLPPLPPQCTHPLVKHVTPQQQHVVVVVLVSSSFVENSIH
jgi:hypothetical protein